MLAAAVALAMAVLWLAGPESREPVEAAVFDWAAKPGSSAEARIHRRGMTDRKGERTIMVSVGEYRVARSETLSEDDNVAFPDGKPRRPSGKD